MVPNRYKALDEREELLHITLESNFVRVATLLGEEVIVFTISKLEVYLPYIR